jgi:hypothetical protein
LKNPVKLKFVKGMSEALGSISSTTKKKKKEKAKEYKPVF